MHTTRCRAGLAGLLTFGLFTASLVGSVPAQPVTRPTAAVTAAPSTVAGRLPQTGCVSGSGTASCELFARAGTQLLAGTAIPIYGFSSTALDPVRAPGPTLVVDQGDLVTVTLHNALTVPVALVVSGQPGLPLDTVGVSPGGSKTYTFAATRPGTYRYEAGHTEDQARLVAMGLVGALVVRASGAGTAYGTAASSYDDEAVIVVTEIDPALNTSPSPLAFDMRSYQPRYRLISGKAFPETDVIATDAGRRVLVRYVNGGVQTHPMGVLGAGQTVIAQDGNPAAHPYGATVVALAPGQTLDAVVPMPAAPDGAKYALYETAGQLNNNGEKFGTTQQAAFGGMLTFLDTNAPAPSPDSIGPVSSHVSLSPNPASDTAPVTVEADAGDLNRGNSPVDYVEYVIDDPTIAEGTYTAGRMTGFTPGSSVTAHATGTIEPAVLAALPSGKHRIYVRAKDVAGNWGAITSATLTLATGGALTSGVTVTPATTNSGPVSVGATGDATASGGTVIAAEYFLDSPGANGAGTAMTRNRNAAVVAETGTIPAAVIGSLPDGPHLVSVHSQDSMGIWGPAATATLVIDRQGPDGSNASVDPNPNNGSRSSPVDPNTVRVSVTLTDAVSPLRDGEGFIDTPGIDGNGFPLIAADGAYDSTAEDAYGTIPLSQVRILGDGPHPIWVHGKDAAGNWGAPVAAELLVDTARPLVTSLAATPNPTGTRPGTGALTLALSATATDTLTAIQTAEWFDGTDPGSGNGIPMTVNSTGLTAAVQATIDLRSWLGGSHAVSVRVQDAAGNWSPVSTVRVSVAQTNALLSDDFESGTTQAWSGGATGGATPSSAAPRTGHYGLATDVTGHRPAYLTDLTPNQERGYHAQFGFNASTLRTGNAAVDVLAGRNAAGVNVLRVQYRRAGNSPMQLRVGAIRTGGTSYTPWRTLTPGWHTVRVDWASATAGSVRLRVDGALVASLARINNPGARIDTMLFGPSTGLATASGTAYFDDVVTTRFTLP